MEHTHEIEQMCVVAKGAKNGPAPIPQEGKWTQVKEIKDIQRSYPWCRLVRASAGSL